MQNICDEIAFICEHGTYDDVDDTLDLAADAYTLACQHGCDVSMPSLVMVHDALRLADQLLLAEQITRGRTQVGGQRLAPLMLIEAERYPRNPREQRRPERQEPATQTYLARRIDITVTSQNREEI